MSVRFEITTEPGTVAPGDLVVLRLVTQKGGVAVGDPEGRCQVDVRHREVLHRRRRPIGHRAEHRQDTGVRRLRAGVLHQVHTRRSANGYHLRRRGGVMGAATRVCVDNYEAYPGIFRVSFDSGDVRAAVVLTRPQLELLRSCVTDSLARDDAVRRRRGGDL